MLRSNFTQGLGLETEFRHVQAQVLLVEQAHDDFFAEERGNDGNAEIEFFLLAVFHILDHDSAVLRQPLFADVQLGHDLYAASDRIFQFQGRRHHVLQNSVNAEADPVFFLVRLDVNIAGPALHGIGQNQVHKFDDGRFVGGLFELRQIHFRFFCCQFQVGFIAGQVLHHLVDFFAGLNRAVKLPDRFADGRFRRNHRLHVESGHELDIVHGEDVGRIRHRDRQRRSHAGKRHDLVANGGLLRNQFDDRGVYFVEFEVDRRNAVLAGQHRSNVLVTDQAHFDETGPQAAAILLLVVERLLQLILGDQAVLYQNFAQPRRHTSAPAADCAGKSKASTRARAHRAPHSAVVLK